MSNEGDVMIEKTDIKKPKRKTQGADEIQASNPYGKKFTISKFLMKGDE